MLTDGRDNELVASFVCENPPFEVVLTGKKGHGAIDPPMRTGEREIWAGLTPTNEMMRGNRGNRHESSNKLQTSDGRTSWDRRQFQLFTTCE